MAFDKAGLNLAAASKSGNAPKIWTYKTADTLATVDGAGYFDDGATTNTGMRNSMSVGDLIYCYTTTGPAFGLLVVNANASGVIDCSNATSLGTVDSD
jgi:hypothetical protein